MLDINSCRHHMWGYINALLRLGVTHIYSDVVSCAIDASVP